MTGFVFDSSSARWTGLSGLAGTFLASVIFSQAATGEDRGGDIGRQSDPDWRAAWLTATAVGAGVGNAMARAYQPLLVVPVGSGFSGVYACVCSHFRIDSVCYFNWKHTSCIGRRTDGSCSCRRKRSKCNKK